GLAIETSMLNARGPQPGQHGDNRAVNSLRGWTQSFARTRVRPKRVGTMARGGLVVKRRGVQTPHRAAPAPASPPPRTGRTPAPPRAPWSARSSYARRTAPARAGSDWRLRLHTDRRSRARSHAPRPARAR